MWWSLRDTYGEDPRPSGLDFEGLIKRVRSQRRRLEQQPRRASHDAPR